VAESVAVRRLCLVAGIEGYSQNDNRAQAELQRRLKDTLEQTLKSANVALERTWYRDQGDGQLILLPVGVKPAGIVPRLIRGLLEHLDRDRDRAPLIPLRLRVSVVPGIVTRTPVGYAGRPVVLASRIAESPAAREELSAQRTALFTLIVSDDLYQDVFVHGSGETGAAGFRRVTIDMPDKQWREDAWVRAWEPDPPMSSANRAVNMLRDAVMPVIDSIPEMLDNPEIEHELDSTAHDTSEPHEEWVAMSTTEDHAAYFADYNGNFVEEYGDHAEYSTVDYESFDSPSDSHEELY
jgi:hypothetical protein